MPNQQHNTPFYKMIQLISVQEAMANSPEFQQKSTEYERDNINFKLDLDKLITLSKKVNQASSELSTNLKEVSSWISNFGKQFENNNNTVCKQ